MYLVKRSFFLLFYPLLVSLALVSCGGGGTASFTPTLPNTTTPAVNNNQGGFQTISKGVTNHRTQIQSTINTVAGQNFQAVYGVNAYKLEYISRDAQNALIKVSALMAIPDKSTPSPLLSYQHATIFANHDAPSFHLHADNKSLEVALASLGYIVVSADYIGYGSSFGHKHPYLQKQPSADVVIDMLKAAKAWLDVNHIQTDGRLFMSGYSQGGYVSMAAMQELQDNPQAGLQVTAAALGAGPYDLETTLDTLLLGINVPNGLQSLAISLLEQFIIPDNAEVKFERTFLQRHFSGDTRDNVYQWRPDYPVRLFHGKDDKTVPIESAQSTLATMKNLGADIELIPCNATPANHLNCVLPYLKFMLDYYNNLNP